MALNKLYRDGERGMIAGVCAGLSDYFDLNVRMTRIVVAISALFFPSLIVVYIVLAVLLKKKTAPPQPENDSAKKSGGRDSAERHATLASVRRRFRDLDARLQRLEKHVTSERFRLDREFDSLRNQGL